LFGKLKGGGMVKVAIGPRDAGGRGPIFEFIEDAEIRPRKEVSKTARKKAPAKARAKPKGPNGGGDAGGGTGTGKSPVPRVPLSSS
ncbi:MAG: hypothetical protein KDJ77_13170, partial [Rhodobiaceae bacterium]|nr:hypothetical protein [Rhodobiaceae bacterium]